MADTKDQPKDSAGRSEELPRQRPCLADSLAGLPLELRPRPRAMQGGLREVKCPGCGRLCPTWRAPFFIRAVSLWCLSSSVLIALVFLLLLRETVCISHGGPMQGALSNSCRTAKQNSI